MEIWCGEQRVRVASYQSEAIVNHVPRPINSHIIYFLQDWNYHLVTSLRLLKRNKTQQAPHSYLLNELCSGGENSIALGRLDNPIAQDDETDKRETLHNLDQE